MAASALMMAGCSNEENTSSTYVAEGTPITVNAVVGEMQTKAEDGKTAVTKDFYLKIVNEKKTPKYSYYAAMNYANSAWSAYTDDQHTAPLRMYWAGDGQPVKVTAATFDFDTNSALTLKAQTNQMSSINGSDHLVMTETPVNPTTNGTTINVNFKHVMSKIVVKIDLGKETAYTQTPINELYIEGTETERNFSISDCTFSPLSTPVANDILAHRSNFTEAVTDGTSTTVGATVTKAATVSFEAILVPQTVTKGNLTISFQLSDGKAYKWSTASDVTLATNTEYTLNLQLIGDKITMKNISVSPWNEVTKNLGTGVVSEATVEAFSVLEIDGTNTLLTSENIAAALKGGGTKLKITGTLSSDEQKCIDVEYNALSNNTTITELDLSDLKGDYIDYLFLNGSVQEYNNYGYSVSGVNTTITKLTLPKVVTEISDHAFYGTKITEFTIPATVTIEENQLGGSLCIKSNAFAENTSLTEVTILGNVVPIPNNAFENCSELKKVTFKGALTRIGKSAFNGCNNLTDLYLTNCTSLPEIDDTNTTAKNVFTNTNGTKVHLNKTLYDKLTSEQYYSTWETYLNNKCVTFTYEE